MRSLKLEYVAILQAAVMASPFSVEEIAVHLDMRPSTLYAKLNPYPNPDSRHSLALEDALEIARHIGDETLARAIAEEFLDHDEPDGHDMDEECLQGFRAVATLIEAIKLKRPYEELIALDNRAHKEISDIIKRRRDEELQLTRRVA